MVSSLDSFYLVDRIFRSSFNAVMIMMITRTLHHHLFDFLDFKRKNSKFLKIEKPKTVFVILDIY